jgi:hypothetical protein
MDVSWFFLVTGEALDEPELEGSANLVDFMALGDICAES